MTALVSDTFTGTATTLDGHAPDVAPGGLVWAGSSGQLSGGFFAPYTATNEYITAYLYDAAGFASADNGLIIEVTFNESAGDPTQIARIVANFHQVPSETYISRDSLAVLEMDTGRTVRVVMKDSANVLNYGSYFSLSGSPGDSQTMRLEIENGVERVYINGTLRHTVSGTSSLARTMEYLSLDGSIGTDVGTNATAYTSLEIRPLSAPAVVADFWTSFVGSHEVP